MQSKTLELAAKFNTPVTTLVTPGLTTRRKDGNTTRQVDFAIQKLFEGKTVLLEDHVVLKFGSRYKFSKLLLYSVQRRLDLEHRMTINRHYKITMDSKKRAYKIKLINNGNNEI